MLVRSLIPATLAVALLAAPGGAYASGRTAGGVAAASTVRAGTVVKLRKTAFGRVLVDSRGRTLYLYTPDRRNTSVCYGQCATFWPPLLTRAKPRALVGVKAGLLGTTKRKDGKLQVTYAGHPLYFFANDSKAGQTNGQGVQGIWWVVSAAGKKVTKKAAVRSTAATTVQLRQTSVGMVLVDSRGHTLYLYAPDTSRKSTCAGQCAALWPPLLAHGKLVPGQGLKSSLLGTVERGDGKLQVTYGGHPLYGFASDDKPGDTHGQGMGGKWYVLGADGSKVEDSSGGGTTTTPGGGGGY
jgi:predicted lipoprotein with Yx(FWY)xxD motif